MIEKITIFKDPRKRKKWICRWFGKPDLETGKSKRYSKSFDTRREAEKFKAKQITAFDAGTPRDRPPDIGLKQFCSEWMVANRADLRPASRELYDQTFRRLYDYFGKNAVIRSITAQEAAKFVGTQMRRDGDGSLSNWTRHRLARNCRTMFKDAVTWHLISANPFIGVGPKKKTLKVRDWHELTPQQFHQLLAGVNLRKKATYNLFYCLGLRLGEGLSLMWPNINFEKRTVKIKDRPATDTEPPFYVKDYEDREIPIPQFALTILENLQAYNDLTDQSPYVCLSDRQYTTLQAKWQRYRSEEKTLAK
jgi:site-specific recombinase XerD